jgi:arsenate reductase-like glutaredoxin family protein
VREVLSGAEVPFTERDFFSQPFTADDLRALLGGAPARDILASRSPSARSIGADLAGMGDDDLLSLMVQEPRLIRRPLLVVDGRLVIGANAKTVERLLAP